MKKSNLTYIIVFIISFNISFSQDTIYVKNDTYIRRDNNWYLIDESTCILFPVNESEITVKFKSDAGSIDSCLNYLSSKGILLKPIRGNILRWIDFEVPEGTNIFELCNQLLQIEIIENAVIGLWGYYFDVVPLNGKFWNMNPNPASSYINMWINPYCNNFVNNYTFEFIDIPTGRLVKLFKFNGPHNIINIEDLSPGSYAVRLTINHMIYKKTLIIQR
jgi:hypothetical protein